MTKPPVSDCYVALGAALGVNRTLQRLWCAPPPHTNPAHACSLIGIPRLRQLSRLLVSHVSPSARPGSQHSAASAAVRASPLSALLDLVRPSWLTSLWLSPPLQWHHCRLACTIPLDDARLLAAVLRVHPSLRELQCVARAAFHVCDAPQDDFAGAAATAACWAARACAASRRRCATTPCCSTSGAACRRRPRHGAAPALTPVGGMGAAWGRQLEVQHVGGGARGGTTEVQVAACTGVRGDAGAVDVCPPLTLAPPQRLLQLCACGSSGRRDRPAARLLRATGGAAVRACALPPPHRGSPRARSAACSCALSTTRTCARWGRLCAGRARCG